MFDNLPNSRKAASGIGSPKYFTGEKCKHGHLTYRYTASGVCAACSNPRTYLRDADGLEDYKRRVHPKVVRFVDDYIANMNALAKAGLI